MRTAFDRDRNALSSCLGLNMEIDCFISYASEDRVTANAICAVLEDRRVRCWYAPRDITPGLEYGEAILHGIEKCKVLVLVLSTASNESIHVRKEVERAVSKGKYILPFRIEDIQPSSALEYALGNTHWLDAFTVPVEESISKLATSISILIERQFGETKTIQDAHSAHAKKMETSVMDMAATQPNRSSDSSLIDKHLEFLTKIGQDVLNFIKENRKQQMQFSVSKVFEVVRSQSPTFYQGVELRKYIKLVEDSMNNNCAPGLTLTKGILEIPEDHIRSKVQFDAGYRREIAEKASEKVKDGMVVSLDGGSTTLSIVEVFLQRLDSYELLNITIVTNSVPIVNLLAEYTDRNGPEAASRLQSYLVGGYFRATTHATSDVDGVVNPATASLAAIKTMLGQIDVAFVGCNGISENLGVTIPTSNEISIKRKFIECASEAFIVCSFDKFGVEFEYPLLDASSKLAIISDSRYEKSELVSSFRTRWPNLSFE